MSFDYYIDIYLVRFNGGRYEYIDIEPHSIKKEILIK